MGTELVSPQQALPAAIEQALISGDLSRLQPAERVNLYQAVCQSLKLNPLTKPFAYIQLNGKLQLYALKDCTDQLRSIHAISVEIASREVIDDVYVVTARALRPDGRYDSSTGAVPVTSLKGEAKANAMMKAETKAKRRVTLSICGLGMLDESEIDSIRGAKPIHEEYFPETVAAAERRYDADMAKQRKLSMAEKKQIAQAETVTASATTRGDAPSAAESPSGHHNQLLPSAANTLVFEGRPVPPDLVVLVAGIMEGRKGFIKDGLTIMKKQLEEADPEMGAAFYRETVERHCLRDGKPDPKVVVTALLEMWNAVELRKHMDAPALREYVATDDDISGLLPDSAA